MELRARVASTRARWLPAAAREAREDAIKCPDARRRNANGSGGLLSPGVSIALDAGGPAIVPAPRPEALGTVEVRTLFTALCHLSAAGPGSMPLDSLEPLATEATSALAAQVNRLSPE